jgi:hypothetical protein
MIQETKLATFEGQAQKSDQDDKNILWRSNKDTLGEAVESVMAKLLELKNNPYGIPLQRVFKDGVKPDLSDTTLVEIQDVYIESMTQEIVATLTVKEQQTPVGADEKVDEEMVDEAVEDSFPASDPPALKPTR